MSVPVSWVVSLLAALEPSAPWSDTYEKTAEAIARVAESDPLYAVEDQGEERTASILVALAWYESRLKPTAKSKNGQWYCLYQVHKSYLSEPEKALTDPEACTRAAMKILKRSFQTCTTRAPDERLAIFMSGVCDRGGVESKHRMYLAKKLLKEHPVPPPSGGSTTAPAR
jgi:hypothetical protein